MELNNKISIKSNRNSSIELLRIIAIIMIIFHHFAIHGGFNYENSDLVLPRFWYNFIYMFGKTGADIFVLISGYFMISNTTKFFDIKKIFRLWGQIFFYSIAIYLYFHFRPMEILGNQTLKSALMPISYGGWWFASTYFVLFIIHPFLNILLHTIDKKIYQYLILMLVFCWSIIPTITTQMFESNNLLWFITLYVIAGYAKLHGYNKKINVSGYYWGFVLFTLITYIINMVLTIETTKHEKLRDYIPYFYGQEKITTLLMAFCLFMMFVNIKMNYHKWINVIASASFGVYLIHDNNYIRPLLWHVIFKNADYQYSNKIIIYSIFVVAIVFVICTIIDLIRKYTIEKIFMFFVNRYAEKLLIPIKFIVRVLRKKVF